MPTWILASVAVVMFLTLTAALGAWLAVEAQHRRLLMASEGRRGRHQENER